MAYPLPRKSAVSDPQKFNAGSDAGFISKSAVLEIIERQCAAFEHLNFAGGLSPDRARRYTRDQCEIVTGKLMALDSVRHLVSQILPKNAGDFMAEKPDSSAVARIDSRIEAFAAAREESRLGAFAFNATHEEREVFFHCWNRHDASIEALAGIRDDLKFSGNAEEQPGRREESGPTIGITPVTSDPANPRHAQEKGFPGVARDFLDWCKLNLDGLTSKELSAVSELALEELEARGTVEAWQPVG